MAVRPFISYAREDREIAVLLHAELTAVGAEPWLDAVNLVAGEDWELAIERALADATHVIALISARSVNKRGYVQKELRKALALLEEWPPGTIYVIPVRLDMSQPRHQMLQRLHWIDLFEDYGAGLRRLIAAMNLAQSTEPRPVMSEMMRGYGDVPSNILAAIVSRAQHTSADLKSRGAYVKAEIESWRFVSSFHAPEIALAVQRQISSNLARQYPDSFTEQKLMLPREILGWKLLQTIEMQFADSSRFNTLRSNALQRWPHSFAGQYFDLLSNLHNVEDLF